MNIEKNKIYTTIENKFQTNDPSIIYKSKIKGDKLLTLKTYYFESGKRYSMAGFRFSEPENASYWIITSSGDIYTISTFGNNSCLADVVNLFAGFGIKCYATWKANNFDTWQKRWKAKVRKNYFNSIYC